MAGNIKGITIEIGGDTTKLDKALKDVNKTSRDLNTELREINTSLKFNPKNVELMAQKQRSLGDSIENSKEKLEQLALAQEQAKKQLAEGNIGQDEYDALRREIIKTENQLKGFERQLDAVTNKWKVAGSAMQEFGGKLDKAGQKIGSMGKDLTTKVTLPLAAVGAASFKMAADTQDAMGATDQIFKNSADEMKEWAGSIPSYYGIAKGEALEYSNTMGAMLKNIGGLSEAEAAKQSQILTQLAGDLSAMYGGTTESAIQALTGALKGNNAMLDNYGMGVNEATIKTKAFELGLVAEGEQLTLAEKQAATLALIMEQTADAQGQAAREADGASGSFKAFQTEVKNLSTNIGDVLLPIITPIIQKVGEFVQKFKDLSPEAQKFIVIAGMIAAAIGPIMMVLGPIVALIGKIIGVIGIVSQAIGVMSTGIAVASPVVMGVVAVLTKLGAVFGIIKAAVIAFAAALNLPVIAAVAVGAAIAAVVYAIVTNWETVKTKTIEILTAIVAYVFGKFTELKNNTIAEWEAIKNAITTAINMAKTIVTTVVGAIRGFISGVWNGIKSTTTRVWNNVLSAIKTPIEKARDIVKGAIEKIKSFLNITLPFPKIKLPHFKIEGSFSLKPPRVPSFGVEWYDKGGIFNSPSIIGVGEKRPEFVGALDDLKKLMREVLQEEGGRNVVVSGDGLSEGYIKVLLDEMRALIEAVKSDNTIVIDLDGREVARGTYKYDQEFVDRENKMRSRRKGEIY